MRERGNVPAIAIGAFLGVGTVVAIVGSIYSVMNFWLV